MLPVKVLQLGARVLDKALTQESGFLSKLELTDEIMADQGFGIEELALQGTKLTIPASTKGKKQLSHKDVELFRQIASVLKFATDTAQYLEMQPATTR